MQLVFAEPAERDLANIIDYIARDNPTVAERVYRAIAATTARLTRFPEMLRPAAVRAHANSPFLGNALGTLPLSTTKGPGRSISPFVSLMSDCKVDQ